MYEQDRAKYYQLILPIEFAQVMELLHKEQGHQEVECLLGLVYKNFHWSILLQDVTN